MPDRDAIVEAIRTHCRAENTLDSEAYFALFADDIVIEDPVGIGLWRGIDALKNDFWASVERAQPKLKMLQEPIVCGNEAIAMLSAEINHEGERITISPIVVNFVYNDSGKVRHLRSFMNYG